VCAILTGLAAGPLAGDAAADRETGDAARVDWAAGWLIAGGTGIADRHAPSPAVALGTSRRGAEDAARRRLAGAVGALPLASRRRPGGPARRRRGQGAGRRRRRRGDRARGRPETDGSWHVTLAVPLEAIRLALEAPRALPTAGDHGPAVVVVDGVAARPAIAWTVAGRSTEGAGPWCKGSAGAAGRRGARRYHCGDDASELAVSGLRLAGALAVLLEERDRALARRTEHGAVVTFDLDRVDVETGRLRAPRSLARRLGEERLAIAPVQANGALEARRPSRGRPTNRPPCDASAEHTTARASWS
jgi:hypothetical protein